MSILLRIMESDEEVGFLLLLLLLLLFFFFLFKGGLGKV